MQSNEQFLNFVNELHAGVLLTDEKASAYTVADSDRVLRSVAEIAGIVRDRIEDSFPDKIMDDASCAAVVGLESTLLRLRGQEQVRLSALQQFEAINSGAVN